MVEDEDSLLTSVPAEENLSDSCEVAPDLSELSFSDESDSVLFPFPSDSSQEDEEEQEEEEVPTNIAPAKEADDDSIIDRKEAERASKAYSTYDLIGQIIGPTRLIDFASCPCCHSNVDPEEEVKTQPLNAAIQEKIDNSLITESMSESESDNDCDSVSVIVPPDLNAAGVLYSTRKVLVEGWLHKKGTGKDMMRSQAWKARWVRLTLARAVGSEIDTPLLCVFWYPNSTTPSNIIQLDATVVISVDIEEKEELFSYRFEIRKASTRANATMPVARTFAAPRKGRDAWVYAISQALLTHEKQKDRVRKSLMQGSNSWSLSPTPTFLSSPSSSLEELWPEDRFMTIETRPSSPVNSPPASPTTIPPWNPRVRALNRPTSPPNLPRPALKRPIAVPRKSNMMKMESLFDKSMKDELP
jgi:PH domain